MFRKIIIWLLSLFSTNEDKIYKELDEINKKKSLIMDKLHVTLRQRKVEQDEKKRERLDTVYNNLLAELRVLVAHETTLRARL